MIRKYNDDILQANPWHREIDHYTIFKIFVPLHTMIWWPVYVTYNKMSAFLNVFNFFLDALNILML